MNEHTPYIGLMSDLKLKYPFTCIVGGLSGSEKTFVIIKHADVMFTEVPQSISWYDCKY